MKYIVEVNGERLDVALTEGVATVGDGVESRVHDGHIPGRPVRLVTVDGATHRVQVRPQPGRGRYTLWIDGWRYEVDALDERQRAIRDLTRASAAAAGPAPLRAPMPGLVVRVGIAVGDTVAPGDGLIVMEAMKMENELRATTAGTVTRILVEPGMAVEKGAVLVELG